jgi:hypothetical protein
MSQLVLGPATTEQSVLCQVRRKCKVNPTSPDAYTSDATIVAYANEEMQRLASECRSIKSSNIGLEQLTVVGQRMYDLPSNCLELVDVYVGAPNAQIRLSQGSTEEMYNIYGPGYFTRNGQPFHYYIDWDPTGNAGQGTYALALAMVPNVAGFPITQFFVLKPALFTVGTNTAVPQIDDRLDQALIYGIAAQIMHDKRDPAFEGLYSQKRQEYVQKYNDSGRKSREPLSMLNNNFQRYSFEM